MLAGAWQEMKNETVDAKASAALAISWSKLCKSALEPAGFNAPELALPILKHFGGANLATVQLGPDLLFAVPLQNKRFYNQTWRNPLIASGVPHVAQGLSEQALQSFINTQNQPVLFRDIPENGPFKAVLESQSSHFKIIESWQRAAFKF
jgi:hypothetical protein